MSTETVHDPVCHMDITIDSAAGSSQHQGQTYYFCARGCKLDFDENPDAVLQAEAGYDHGQPMEHGMTDSPKKKAWWRFWG